MIHLITVALIVAFMVSFPPVQGTTVVAVSTRDSVVLGADSKIVRDETNASDQKCKMVLFGSHAAAMAGHLGDSATGLDVEALLRRALGTRGNLESKVSIFETLVRGHFSNR